MACRLSSFGLMRKECLLARSPVCYVLMLGCDVMENLCTAWSAQGKLTDQFLLYPVSLVLLPRLCCLQPIPSCHSCSDVNHAGVKRDGVWLLCGARLLPAQGACLATLWSLTASSAGRVAWCMNLLSVIKFGCSVGLVCFQHKVVGA
eukprot:1137720-Pelagomonas_calceolata.AAC.8